MPQRAALRGLLICDQGADLAYLAPRLRRYASSWLCLREATQKLALDRLHRLILATDIVVMHAGVSRRAVVSLCQSLGKPLLVVPELSELAIAGARIEHIDDVVMLSIAPITLSRKQMLAKRVIDILGALILLLLASPIFLLLWILIPLTSKGPVFFRQERLGRARRPFTILKFRTMIPKAEEHTGPVLATYNDPRITWLGRWLRALRLDELPQLLNVLWGDMSLVGPRPERECFVDQFEKTVPGYGLRMSVKPGITGLAQVKGRYDTSADNKLRLDLLYMQRYSLALDLKILLETTAVVLRPERAVGLQPPPVPSAAYQLWPPIRPAVAAPSPGGDRVAAAIRAKAS